MNLVNSLSEFPCFIFLPSEVEERVLEYVPDLSISSVCQKWNTISKDADRTCRLLDENKKQWKIEHEMQEGQAVKDSLKKVRFIQTKLIERIKSFLQNKQVEHFYQRIPSFPFFN